MASLPLLAQEHDAVAEILMDPDVSHAQVLRAINTMGFESSDRAVRRYRKDNGWQAGDRLHTPPREENLGAVAQKGVANITPTGGDFKDVQTDTPLETHDDWRHVFEKFHLNPDEFVVVDDTVRCSTWQQSKRLENGDRDVQQLYSYSARFRRVAKDAISPERLSDWRSTLMDTHFPPPPRGYVGDSTYLILVADPQLGKKGTEEAVENWRSGVLRHLEEARILGRAVGRVHLAFMGDETEGYANHYGNQTHTIELNLSQQLELDFDLRVWTIKEAAKLGLPLSVSSVISNHGEITRNGSKDPVTTRNDNSSTHIARQVKKLFDEIEPYGGPTIEWTVGDVYPGITVDLSGVPCYFSHGYVEKGRGSEPEVRTKNALERQILGRTADLGSVPLWFMAHYHHFYTREFEGRTLFGCPALEAEQSSEYMRDQYGIWSPPGVLGLLVGRHIERGWSHLNVF